jgi:AcrR family transcriptional regulator
MPSVRTARRYDSRSRRAQAERNRDQVLDVARRRFLADGYAPTTVASIAEEAGVSVETVYKAFGGKPGLVRAIWERGLTGSGPVPAPQRSDEMQARERDPAAIVRNWGALSTEVAPRVAPILLLIRAGAGADPELARLLADADRQRRERMRHNARTLAERGELRAGVGLERATDVLWAFSSPELYELLVLRSGWDLRAYGEFLAESMIAALLP